MYNVSPISKALQEIHFNIPNEILYNVFMNNANITGESVDGVILSTVIKPRVMVDCNLLGGQELKIDLSQATYQYVDGRSVVYKIPKKLTNGRSIVSALSLSPYNYGGGSSCGSQPPIHGYTGSNLMDTAYGAMDNYSQSMSGFNARLDVIGENTILVKYNGQVVIGGLLRVRVANEENMNNLQPTSYRIFSKLCVLAVKSYIYNSTYIIRNKAEIYNGQTLDGFRDYIDTLSDAEEQYQEALVNEWQVQTFYDDEERIDHHLGLIMPNGII